MRLKNVDVVGGWKQPSIQILLGYTACVSTTTEVKLHVTRIPFRG